MSDFTPGRGLDAGVTIRFDSGISSSESESSGALPFATGAETGAPLVPFAGAFALGAGAV